MRAWLVLSLYISSPALFAQDIAHTVGQGETFSSIAQRYFGDAVLWPWVEAANPGARERRLVPGSQIIVPSPPAGTGPTVLHVSGSAELVRMGVKRALELNAQVLETDQIDVPPNAYVTLKWPDGAISHLLPGSNIRIAHYGAPARGGAPLTAVDIRKGAVESAVPKDSGRSFQIRTRWGVAGVRGTSFGVRIAGADGMITEVRDGAVEVAGRGFSPISVTAGHGALVDASTRQPGVRRMLAPPPAAEDLTLTPASELSAGAVPGAVSYELQLRRAEFPVAIIFSATAPTPGFSMKPLADGQYLASLRAVDSDGIPGMPSSHLLTIVTISEPFLSEPRSGSVLPGDSETRFRCSDVPNADGYEFALTSSAPAFETRTFTSQGSCTLALPSLPQGDYSWKATAVKALANGGVLRGAASQPGNFTIVARPAAPALRQGAGSGLHLEWDGADGDRFVVQLSPGSEFSRIVSEKTVDEAHVLLEVPAGETYFVRIKKIAANQIASEFSAPRIVRGPLKMSTSDGGAVRASDGSLVGPQ